MKEKILPRAGNFNANKKNWFKLDYTQTSFKMLQFDWHVACRMSLFFSFSVRVHFETFLDVLLIPVTLEHKLGMNIDHNVMHLKEMHKKSSRYSDALESND